MEEWSEFRKKMNPDSLTHRPEFVVKPRGQTVWEGKDVKLHCTVAGWPKPRIAWYVPLFSESQKKRLMKTVSHACVIEKFPSNTSVEFILHSCHINTYMHHGN